MPQPLPLLLFAALTACGAPDAPEPAVSSHAPQAPTPAKADQAAAVFAPGVRHDLRLRWAPRGPDGELRDTDEAVLEDRADGRLTTWRGVKVRRAGEALSLRLPSRARLGGMRRLVLVPRPHASEILARLLTARLRERMGVVGQRLAPATLQLDDDLPSPMLLVEHIGGAFLAHRFDAEGGTLLRAGAALGLPDAELMARVNRFGERGLRTVLSPKAADALACARALGQPAALAWFSSCPPRAPCFRPVGLDAAAALTVDAGDRLEPTLRRAPAADARYRAALRRAAELLTDPALGLSEDAATLGAQTALEALMQAAADRAEALTARLDRALVYPRGLPTERPFTRDAAGDLVFAWPPAAGPEAARARLEWGEHRISLAWNGRAWAGAVPEGPAGPFAVQVQDAEGAWAEVGAGWLEPAEVDRLRPLRTAGLDIREPSGLALDGALLIVVGDAGGSAWRVDPQRGARVEKIKTGGEDLEAVDVDPLTGEILVALEGDAEIWRLGRDGERHDRLHLRWAEDGNRGLEGLAVRPSDGHLFVAKERSPARLAELTPTGERLWRERVDFAPDLSDLCWSEGEGALYALSDEAQVILRLDAERRVTARWAIDVNKPEGLACAGDRVYVVSDADATLTTFALSTGVTWR